MKTFLLTQATLPILGIAFGQDYKFLGEYTVDGTPKYFDTKDEVSPENLQLISDALPEDFPVPMSEIEATAATVEEPVVENARVTFYPTRLPPIQPNVYLVK